MGQRYLTMLAKQAEEGKRGRVAGAFLLSFILLVIPVVVFVMRTPPHELFGRYYGVDFGVFAGFSPAANGVEVHPDGDGFIADVRVASGARIVHTPGGGKVALGNDPEDIALPTDEPCLGITDEYIFYAGQGTRLLIPSTQLPYAVLDGGDGVWDAQELFDDLALYNNWFARFAFPAALLVSMIAVLMLLAFHLIIAAIFGLTRIMSHKMPMGKRMRVLMVCSYPPAVLCCLLGFLLPMMHLFIFELLLIFVALGVSKRL